MSLLINDLFTLTSCRNYETHNNDDLKKSIRNRNLVVQMLQKLANTDLIGKYVCLFLQSDSEYEDSAAVSALTRQLPLLGIENVKRALENVDSRWFDSQVKVNRNLDLIQNLIKAKNEKMAFVLLELLVFPMLDQTECFNKLIREIRNEINKYSYKETELVSIFCKLIVLLVDFECKPQLETLKDEYIFKLLDQEALKLLGGLFMEKKLEKSPLIVAICEKRRDWLELNTARKPEFNWSMPQALYPRSEKIQAFLRSEEVSMKYPFEKLAKAQQFVDSTWNDLPEDDHYSIKKMKVVSSKSMIEKPYVLIQKTKEYFNKQALPLFNQRAEELRKIKSYLCKN